MDKPLESIFYVSRGSVNLEWGTGTKWESEKWVWTWAPGCTLQTTAQTNKEKRNKRKARKEKVSTVEERGWEANWDTECRSGQGFIIGTLQFQIIWSCLEPPIAVKKMCRGRERRYGGCRRKIRRRTGNWWKRRKKQKANETKTQIRRLMAHEKLRGCKVVKWDTGRQEKNKSEGRKKKKEELWKTYWEAFGS